MIYVKTYIANLHLAYSKNDQIKDQYLRCNVSHHQLEKQLQELLGIEKNPL